MNPDMRALLNLPFSVFPFRTYPGVFYLDEPDSGGRNRISVRYLYKFIDLPGLKKMLQNGLLLKEPSQWTDGYERRFYLAAYSSLNSIYKPERVYACCFTTNKNSEASWTVYVNHKELFSEKNNADNKKDYLTIARIKFDRAALRRQLSSVAQKKSITFYECPVQYISTYAIENCHLPDVSGAKRLHNALFEDTVFNRDVFLSLLSMKRRELFEYEQEIRYFCIPQESQTGEMLISLDWNDIIKQISLVRVGSEQPLTEKELSQLDIPFNTNLIEPVDLYHKKMGSGVIVHGRL